MADVFLSYAREDRVRAEQVARGLEAAGVEVFWDNEIPPGQTWADYIEEKLTHCKALIVLWSEHSTKSQWVREEARMGRDKGVLIPAMIDGSQAPFGFGEVQAANLAGWNGDPDHPDWRRFVDAARAFSSRDAPPARPQPAMSAPPRAHAAPPPPATEKKGMPVWVWVVGAVVATVVVLGVLGSMMPATTTTAAIDATTAQPAVTQPSSPPAQGVSYQQQLLDRLGQVEQAFSAQGFQRVSEPYSGQLQQGASQGVPATLHQGFEYRIIGVCDNDCGDLDLALYDQNNNVVSNDQSTDATPIVSATPQWTGAFTVQAHMYNCTVQPCYYALVLYGRAIQ